MIEEHNGHIIAIHSMDKGQTYRASTTADDVAPIIAETYEQALQEIKHAIDNH